MGPSEGQVPKAEGTAHAKALRQVHGCHVYSPARRLEWSDLSEVYSGVAEGCG
jgi:hypothetical protein